MARPPAFRIVTPDDQAKNDFLGRWVANVRKRLSPDESSGLSDGQDEYIVLDPKSGNVRFFATAGEANRAREGQHVTPLAQTRVSINRLPKDLRTPDAQGEADFGDTDPSLIPKTSAGRRAVARIQEKLDTDRRASFTDPTEIQPYLKDLSEREKADALAGFLALAARDERVNYNAAWAAAGKGARGRVDGEFLTDYYRQPDQRTVDEWAERGIIFRSPSQFWSEVKAYEKRQKAEDAGAAKLAASANKSLKGTDIHSLSDLANQEGFGEGSVASLERAGISLADLRAGRVSAERLEQLKGWGGTKVRKLRELGFIVPESPGTKRGPGRPPKSTYAFGKGKDPFASSSHKQSLFGSRTVDVRDGDNNIVRRQQKSKFSEFRENFAASFRNTIGAPFVFIKSFFDSEESRAVRDANKLVGIKRAVHYRTKAEGAKTGFGAGAAKVSYYFQTALIQVLVWTAVLSPILFLPIGILQIGGWMLTGLVIFIIHEVLLLGLTLANIAFSNVVGALDTLGFLMQNSLQGFLDQVPTVIQGGGGTIREYKPIDLKFGIAQVIDPNAIFPDCVNTNTLGAVGLTFFSGLLHSFGAFLAENGSLAVGVAIIILLGIPTYFVSKGTSVAFLAVGTAVMMFPVLSDFTLPMWVVLGLIILLVTGLFLTYTYAEGTGVLGPILGVGALLVAVVGGAIVVDTVDLGRIDFKADIHIGTKPIAIMLGNGVHVMGDASQFIADQVTTGWNKLLDPNKFTGLRDTFNVGETALPPPTGCAPPAEA